MFGSDRLYRVVVVGVSPGGSTAKADLVARLAKALPLPPDARLALEAGRSAVVMRGAPETEARRTATLLSGLGAEVRVEPDDQAMTPATQGLDFGLVDLGEFDASVETTSDSFAVPLDVPLPELEPKDDGTAAPDDSSQDPGEAPASASITTAPIASVEGSRPQLVRCPAHGLLYDSATSAGCSRCLDQPEHQGFRLAPGLRARPRVRLTAGLTLALVLGALPAALYADHVKNTTMLERRIEAEAIRRGRVGDDSVRQAYANAQRLVEKARSRGIAFSGLLWLGTAVLVLGLWLRFV